MSQLNLPCGTDTKSVKQKNEKVKTDMLRSNSKSLGNRVVSPEEEKKSAVGRICGKGRF